MLNARFLAVLFAACMLSLGIAPAWAQKTAVRYGVFEESMLSSKQYANPLKDVQVTVTVTDPRGNRKEVEAFWDGFSVWKFRYMPRMVGPHTFTVKCSDPSNAGLNAPGDRFTAVEYRGENELAKRGPLVLSANRRYFQHADGTPFFLVSDTAWNGALLSDDEEWERYLKERKAQKFNTIQFVTTQWRAAYADNDGQTAFSGVDEVAVNPSFFQRMDKRVSTLNEQGFVGLPVVLWALTGPKRESPGEVLPREQAALLARYIVARYDAFNVLWFLGGDGDYRGDKAERWKYLGREVFPAVRKTNLVSLHPRGQQDPWPGLKDEPWLDFLNYQTGHGSSAKKWNWNATQGTASGWKLEPPRPVFDSEPNYENHTSYGENKVIDAYDVRRASWYSVLIAPPAGITYGTHGVWPWMKEIGVPLNHANSGSAMPWFASLDNPGAESIKAMAEIMSNMPWTTFEPYQALIVAPPLKEDFSNFIPCARTISREKALCYVPAKTTPALNTYSFESGVRATWIDPRTGIRKTPIDLIRINRVDVNTPSEEDWLLLLERK
ncbi:MAG: DUF4038 domain-containing protein [Bryobacterales bacterium]|nr:DUF4038 domain-containing protein [Bryobacterales bacterium]